MKIKCAHNLADWLVNSLTSETQAGQAMYAPHFHCAASSDISDASFILRGAAPLFTSIRIYLRVELSATSASSEKRFLSVVS